MTSTWSSKRLAPTSPIGDATVPLVVRQWVGSSPPALRAPVAGTLPDRTGRGQDVSLGPDPLRPPQPRPGRPGRDAGGLDIVELPRVFPPPRSPGLGGLCLAKHHTGSTRAELVPILGLSRPESVPNLSARFVALLQTESNARRDLVALKLALGLSGENSKSV